ncbi:sodium:solute symporter family transporter [Saccharicrinis aurantiacus]|uniref:sodium:solute symporter family transporter n=1 Tax=Saccharicrinis aurantiacus TaxID=1849719 RepID=UPI0008386590|nr:sodium/solute symporter [Saccharicrinis aurantiacus]
MKLNLIDYIIIIAYILGVVGIGVFTGLKNKKKSSEGFFLAGRNLKWPMVGAALFAANISTIHMVGLAGQGFSDGMVWGNFEWSAALLLIVLGLIFAPFYFKTKISTLPEFLERRYNPQARSVLAFISLVTAIFLHIGVSLYAGGLVFENFFGIDRYMAITIIAVITFAYAFIGGLEAVVITEAIQSVILILGASIMTILAMTMLPEVGVTNWAELKAAVKPDQLSMVHTHSSSPLPWWAFWLGIPVLGLNYWCADQTIVQKVLGAKTLEDAQRGPIFAGFIKILPVFIMVVPGIFAYVLFKDDITVADQALPELILRVLPTGLKGLMSAALLAALMSTIASGLNSAGTMVSMDIVKRKYPDTKDKTLLNIGRITILCVIIVAIAWSPLIAKFPSIFEAINDLLAVLSPPISVVLLFGVFSRKGTPKAGLYTLIFGFVLAVVAFSLDFEMIAGQRYISDVWKIHFMMKAFYMFMICTVFYFAVSAFTPKADAEVLEKLTLKNPLSFITEGKVKSFSDPRVFAGVLVFFMIILYWIFR